MKALFLLTSVALGASVLAACSESPSSRTYTIDELMADEPLLEKLYTECRNNPGELGETPNCVNAFQANHQMKIDKAIQNLKK